MLSYHTMAVIDFYASVLAVVIFTVFIALLTWSEWGR